MKGYKIEIYKTEIKTSEDEVFEITRKIPSFKRSSNKDAYLHASECLESISDSGRNSDLWWLMISAQYLFDYASERDRCESRKVFQHKSEKFSFTTFFECI